LAVFSYLIVPIVCSTLLGRRGPARLYWAWAIGIVASILGAVLSYLKDWPMGATIVCLFGLTVAIVSLSVRMKYVDEKVNDRAARCGPPRPPRAAACARAGVGGPRRLGWGGMVGSAPAGTASARTMPSRRIRRM